MGDKRVREIAETEGVICPDCIHEALMTIQHWDFDLDYRVPADRKREFVEALYHYDMTEHREMGE